MESLILRWGLLALFAGVAVEGDVTMLLGGVAAHLGLHSLAAVLAVGTAAAVTSDTLIFLTGRWGSRHAGRGRLGAWLGRLGARLPDPAGRAGAVARFVERVGPAQLLFVRFLWGMRVPSLILLGSGSASFPRFLACSISGGLLWSTIIGGAGYLFSTTAAAMLGHVRRLEFWFLGALVAAALVVYLLHRLERRIR